MSTCVTNEVLALAGPGTIARVHRLQYMLGSSVVVEETATDGWAAVGHVYVQGGGGEDYPESSHSYYASDESSQAFIDAARATALIKTLTWGERYARSMGM